MNSKAPKNRLGRGFAALLGDLGSTPPAVEQSELRRLPIDLLEANPFQPRLVFDQEAIDELSESIRAQGILQPLIVRDHPVAEGRFQIVVGERRWRAAMQAGLHEVPALVREMADTDAATVALIENLQREDLNPIEEAEGYKRLIADFGLTHEALGYAVSKSRAHVGNIIRLLRLPPEVQSAIGSGALSFGHARALVTLEDPGPVAQQVIARQLSVRETEALVQRQSREPRLVGAPIKSVDVLALERQLSEIFGDRATVVWRGKGSGQLRLSFDSMAMLEEILVKLRV
jgi:ParB family chromosome partitioning protein